VKVQVDLKEAHEVLEDLKEAQEVLAAPGLLQPPPNDKLIDQLPVTLLLPCLKDILMSRP